MQYFSLIDASSGYQYLKLDERSSYLIPFRRYRHLRLLFGAVPTGDIDKIFEGLPNVFGIADDILVVGYNSDHKDHDETL